MVFNVLLDKRAEIEIEAATKYLNIKNKSVLKKFFSQLETSYKLLAQNPYNQIRSDEIRCLPLKGFSYIFHYSLDEKNKVVHIHGFVHTSQDPEQYWIK